MKEVTGRGSVKMETGKWSKIANGGGGGSDMRKGLKKSAEDVAILIDCLWTPRSLIPTDFCTVVRLNSHVNQSAL